MKSRRCWFWIVVSGLAVMSPSVVLADVTGSILGMVTDSSSAVIQRAQVTATNLDVNLVVETTTDATGQFRFLALPVGRYKVGANSPGFRPFVMSGIVLSVNDRRRVDIVLEVAAGQQEITVSANPVEVETTNTQLGDVIEQKKIVELPLNGRSYLDLLGLQPGVAPASSRGEGPGTVSVNGQREGARSAPGPPSSISSREPRACFFPSCRTRRRRSARSRIRAILPPACAASRRCIAAAATGRFPITSSARMRRSA